MHNLLFLSDPMSPAIHAKHLPPAPSNSRTSDISSQSQSYPVRFTLPPPTPIVDRPHSYISATLLALSPQSKFLYAYFPPAQPYSSTGGLACVWESEGSVDTWVVRDFWHFSAEAGVVTMRWLGEEREVRPYINTLCCWKALNCYNLVVPSIRNSAAHISIPPPRPEIAQRTSCVLGCYSRPSRSSLLSTKSV